MLTATVSGDRAVASAMARFAVLAGDMSSAHQLVEQEAEAAARELVPELSGALVGTLRGDVEQQGMTLTIGEGLEYAGVQEGGWPARNIAGHGFMAAGQQVAEENSRDAIDDELDHLIRLVGLGY